MTYPTRQEFYAAREWMDGFDRHAARRNLIRLLLDPPRPIERRRLLGLERWYSGWYAEEVGGIRAPFGWTAQRDWGRDAWILSPLWLVWLLAPFRERWRFYRLAMRVGLWDVKDGDYYGNGWLTCPSPLRRVLWCFVNDRDEVPR